MSEPAVPEPRTILENSTLVASREDIGHAVERLARDISAHYGDQIDSWRMIEFKPMLWTREQVEAATVSRLVLKPG